ncbi:hypothetical protein AVEN_159318-1 [Araneus ventricosus]|uniref:Uncharacterized protein n=1 Tax=Araneus ventricosus TaxID=182803 RepID=A0A4Y2A2R5_ARAVE|nr:hypothetical protein AVEN_159318-1 [Araneus ventricosus]
MSDAITTPIPVEWTWDGVIDRTPPHVPVPDTTTAPVPFEWTWDGRLFSVNDDNFHTQSNKEISTRDVIFNFHATPVGRYLPLHVILNVHQSHIHWRSLMDWILNFDTRSNKHSTP